MKTTRHKVFILAAGLLAPLSSLAQTVNLTVYAKLAGADAVARVDLDTGSAATTPAIACATNSPTNCVGAVATGATVSLVPVTSGTGLSNATFVGWSGCSSVSGDVCSIVMTGAKTVTATFKTTAYTLNAKTYPAPSLTYTPPYGGRIQVAAATPAIDCQTGNATYAACSGAVANGTPDVAVTALPDPGSKVTGWSGCTPVDADPAVEGVQVGNDCNIALMSYPRVVSATFGPSNVPVNVQVSGNGVVASSGADVTDPIDCGLDCTGSVTPGGAITLTATAAAGSKFLGWSGACAGTAPDCTLSDVQSARNAVASFKSASCSSCHANPPVTHSAANWPLMQGCSACHTGTSTSAYTGDTVDASIHMNGATDVVNVPAAAPTAGLAIEILSASIPTDGVTKPSVTFRVTDPANGDAPLAIGTNAGNVGNPAFHLAKLGTDGTYTSYFSRGRTGLTYLVDGVVQQPVIKNWTDTEPSSSATSCTVGTAGCATQASNDTFSSTRLVKLADGEYQYTFSKALTVTDPDQLHTIAMYATRNVDGYNFRAHESIDLAPSGAAVVERQVVADEACNACHGQLQLHGQRRGVKTCLMCHSPQSTDPESGNTVDLTTLVHKIHNGAHLTNTFFIVGHQQHYYEYNEVEMAPSHSGYFESTNAGVHDPGLSRECGLCHDSTYATQAGNAYSHPSRRACGSCHDNVDFATGTGHSTGIVQTDDVACAMCHSAAGVQLVHSRFYEPVTNANFTALTSFPADGHVFTVHIVNVTVDANGRPTVTFDAALDGNPFDVIAALEISSTDNPSAPKASTDPLGGRLPTCNFQLAGPTTDYSFPASGSTATGMGCKAGSSGSVAVNAVADPVVPGRFTITQPSTGSGSTPALFAGKTGSYTLAFEMMYQRQLVSGADTVRKPFSANPEFVTVTNLGGTWVMRAPGSPEELLESRRKVVEFDKCNSCHVDIGFHSNRNRKGPDYCATCHNPMLDNGTRIRFQPADTDTGAVGGQVLPESVSLNVFIHRLHMGSALPSVNGTEIGRSIAATASPWATPGRMYLGANRSAADPGPSTSEFTHFAMPNTMNRCEQCHIDDGAKQTWALNEGTGLLPIARAYRTCVTTTDVGGELWCGGTDPTLTNSTARPKGSTVYTPPLKATCTSCHDSAATNAHADLYTTNPMTAGAIELCAGCHGAGKTFDSLLVHRPVP